MKSPKIVLITGANSGLGKELALSYAKDTTKLYLTARDKKRLDAVAEECKRLGTTVISEVIDVTDQEKMRVWIENIIKNDQVDLVIANAGVSGGTAGGSEDESQTRKIFAINVDGVLNTVLPFISYFEQREKGQIAIISSLSGFRGLPSCPAYSASKGAVKLFGEGIRGLLSRKNINVTVVTPGYIKTPMTDVNKFPMPFMYSAEKAAKLIKKKLQKNPARIAFPLPMHFIVWLTSCLSPIITDPIFSRLPGKAPLK